MQGKRGEEWQSAARIIWRFLGLVDSSTVAPGRLIAALIVVGAALLAVSSRHSIAFPVGALLWLAGAAMAIRGYIRLMRLRRSKSN